jgi:hypothetical protein
MLGAYRGRMGRSVALLVVAVAFAVGGSADANISLKAPTPVRAWGATALLSVREGASFRLATQRGAQPPVPLPGIAPASRPFEADIGPGPSGRSTRSFGLIVRLAVELSTTPSELFAEVH